MPVEYSGSDNASDSSVLCGACLTKKPLYTQTQAPFIFAYPVDFIVRSLKFNFEEKYARLMGELLAASIQDTGFVRPECLVPVPLHRQRYLERGFNQAELIAHFCARKLQIPVANNLLKRVQHTAPQTGLGRDSRKKNMRGAFEAIVAGPLPRHVALVDDVFTTGSTVSEISRELLKAGVERIDIWVFCRAIR